MTELLTRISQLQEAPEEPQSFTETDAILFRKELPKLLRQLNTSNNGESAEQVNAIRNVCTLPVVVKLLKLSANFADVSLLLVDMIDAMIKDLSFGDIDAAYGGFIREGLRSSNELVIRFILDLMIKKKADVKEELFALIFEDYLKEWQGLLQRLTDVLIMVAQNQPNLAMSEYVVNHLTQTLVPAARIDKVMRYRVYDLIIEWYGACGEKILSVYAHILNGLLQELKSKDDVLSKVNALELVVKLCKTSFGVQYLEEAGVFTALKQDWQNRNTDSVEDTLLFQYLLQFVGKFGEINVDVLVEKFGVEVFRKISDNLLNSDDQVGEAAIEAFGRICSTEKGLQYVKDKYENAFRVFGRAFEKRTLTQKAIPVLRAVGAIFGSGSDNPLLSTFFNLYVNKQGDVVSKLIMTTTSPFADFQVAAFSALRGLCSNEFFVRNHIINNNGLINTFLLNRKPNKSLTTEGKVAKYDLVKTIYDTSINKGLRTKDSEFMKLFAKYLNEGAYFVESDVAVAFQSD
jgi:hypothetical protein